MTAPYAWLLLAPILVLSTFRADADGAVNFSNYPSPPERRIYRGEWTLVNGQPEFISWQACIGNAYKAALYWGPSGISEDTGMIQVGPPSLGFVPSTTVAGVFVAGNRTIVTPEAGPVLSFQVRAWEVGVANAQTWEQAMQTHRIAGKGPIFELKTKDAALLSEPNPVIGQAPGFRGFIFGADGVTAILVPEPSTIALCIIALTTLSILRGPRVRK